MCDWTLGVLRIPIFLEYTDMTALVRALSAWAWALLDHAEAAASSAAQAAAGDKGHPDGGCTLDALAALRVLEALASLPEEGQAGRQAEFAKEALTRLERLGGAAAAAPHYHHHHNHRHGKAEEEGVVTAAVVVRGLAACVARVASGA